MTRLSNTMQRFTHRNALTISRVATQPALTSRMLLLPSIRLTLSRRSGQLSGKSRATMFLRVFAS